MFRPSPELARGDPSKLLQPLERLVQLSVTQRRAGLVPELFSTGVRYREEPPGQDEWLTALESFSAYRRSLQTGQPAYIDCEDLCIWLTADCRLRGLDARCVIKLVRPGLMHCLVYLPTTDRFLDPSRALGMGRRMPL